MACKYTYQGKTYEAWEFVDVLAAMPVDELMKYLPMEAKRKLMMLSGDKPRMGEYGDQELENTLRGKSLMEVAEHIVKAAPNEDYRLIAEKVLARLKELSAIGAKFTFNIANAYTVGPAPLVVSRGVTGFSLGGNENSSADVWVNGADVAGRSGMTYETVLHELIHASMKSLMHFSNAPQFEDTPYGKNIEDLYAVAAHIQNYARERFAAYQRGEIKLNPAEKAILNGSNGISNADEILAWGMTNRKVQDYFESIPYQNRGAWSAFVDAVRNILGLSAKQHTALSEILRVADEMYAMPLFAMNERAKAEGWMMQRVMPEGEGFSGQSTEDSIASGQFVHDFLQELSFEEDAFRYPITKAKSLEENMLNALPASEYMGEDSRPDEMDESKADRRFVFTMPPSADGDQRIFYVFTKGDEVWIDVSRLRHGDQGSAVYHAVGNYAYNNDKVFVGDPNGLSEDAVIRRASAMLSSAMRFGTTEHLGASPEMIKGNPGKGIEPLDWRGSDLDKTLALIHTFTKTLQNLYPGIKNARYDFNTRQFIGANGLPIHRGSMGAFYKATISPGGRAARAGEATLRRGILIQSLMAAESGQRPGILESVLRGASQLVKQDGGGLDSLFSVSFNPMDYLNGDDASKIVGDSGRDYDQHHRQFFKNVGRDVTPNGLVKRTREYLANDFWKKMAVGIVDQFRGLRDLGDNGQAYMLARLSKGTAGAFETLLHHGKLSIKDGVYDGDQSGGFIEKLGVPLHGELDDFLWWIAANRAEGLASSERENLFTEEDIAAGKSLASGETAFDYTLQTGPDQGQTTRSRALVYEDAHRVFNEFQKNTLDIAEQSGLIDGAARQFWESEFYVPFYRVSEEDGEFIGAKMGQSLVRQQAFKKLKGGTDKLNSDLLSNTLLNWSHLIEASAKNRAAKATLTAAEATGAAHRASYGDKNTVWYMGETTRTLPAGKAYMENGQMLISDGSVEVTTTGKIEYVVDDPFVLTAITSLEYAGMRNGIMDVMTKFKHWLTIGVTASPAFKVRNLIRDSVQAIGTSDLGYNPAGNVGQGFAIADGKTASKNFAKSLVGMSQQKREFSPEYVSALASGGLIRFGTMLEGKQSDRIRQLIKSGVKESSILDSEPKWQQFYDKYMEPAIDAYNELGNVSEEISRAALYNQLIKQGKSHAEAALLARDLMDFSMQGSFNTIRFLTQVVPFMNARLQGMYKLGRSAKDNPRKLAVVTGAVAMASIALMLAYGDDDDWKRREDWDRDNFWWFRLGGVEFRIPKPFEVGAVGTLAERSLEYFINDEMTGERFRNVVGALVSHNLSMNPVPQLFKPVVDLYANKDSFTGRPIESMSMQRLESSMRYNSNTSLVARGLSTATGGIASPVQYDHIVRAYFGWLGSFSVGAADMLTRPMTDEPDKPDRDYWKWATQGILKEQGSGNSRYLTMVYDQANELEQAHATYRQMIKEGKVDEAGDYANDHADQLNRYRAVAKVKSTLAKHNERIREIQRSDIDSAEKKRRIDMIQKVKEGIAKRISPGT